MTALPFVNSSPPIAGNKARARGAECQWDGSLVALNPPFRTRGSSKSSVEDLIDCLASSSDSVIKELRLGAFDLMTSAIEGVLAIDR